jgi:NADH-quinone oxidoreductase subunit N
MNALIIIAIAGVICMMAEVFHFKKAIVPIIALALIAAMGSIVNDWNQGASWFNQMLVTDNYALAFSALLIVTTLLWLIMARSYFSVESNTAEHSSLILFALAGGIIMVSYADLTMLFIGLEILSISLYVLAGSDKKNVRSNEAGLKYFLMGAFATGFLLFGIALIYGATGSFNLQAIADSLRSQGNSAPGFVLAGVLLIMTGLCFKIAAVPFHFWAPDVYEGAPTLITAFMATVVKTAAFAAFYRLFSTSFVEIHDTWASSLAIISAASMVGGNLLAVWQQSLKRMLAYSSIAHAGYMLMAIVAFNQQSSGAIFLYAASYSLSSMGAFALLHSVSSAGNEQISSLRGLAHSRPFIAFLMVISLLSLAGIPPVAGFFAKYYLFTATLQSGYIWLVITAVISSLIGVYYYFRVLYTLFQNGSEIEEIPASHKMVMIVSALLSMVIGLMPALLQQLL